MLITFTVSAAGVPSLVSSPWSSNRCIVAAPHHTDREVYSLFMRGLESRIDVGVPVSKAMDDGRAEMFAAVGWDVKWNGRTLLGGGWSERSDCTIEDSHAR